MSRRALVLMYHIIDIPRAATESKYCCLPGHFAKQMSWLGRTHHPVSLDALLAGLDGREELPEGAAAVTFDDGFTSTFEHALPILAEHGIPATMFIVADRIGGDNDWMHRRGMPRRRLMDQHQIRDMHAAGIAIGSHTLTHPRLPECTPQVMRAEITDSKARLEDILSSPVTHFAYPFGLFDANTRELVEQCGYHSACSTRSGFNSGNTDRYELRRIEVFGSDRLRHLRRKMKFGTNEASWSQPARYYLRRALSRLSGGN